MTDSPRYYTWKGLNCAYTVRGSSNSFDAEGVSSQALAFKARERADRTSAIVTIHPIGVGLSKVFWQPFIKDWLEQNPNSSIYNPDLIGCGDGDMPSVAYYPIDWAEQLKYFIENIVKQPVVLIVQGASFPIAIKLIQITSGTNSIKGLVLSTPPAWRTMTEAANPLTQKSLWNLLFDSPVGLGQLFYLYARRRQFLESFSKRQLFADALQVDSQWLDSLIEGAKDLQSRYAVFSFLAGFWREDYTSDIVSIELPTLIVLGKQTSSISRESFTETLPERANSYVKHLTKARVSNIEGRNVLPVESTSSFVKVLTDNWQYLTD
ncbi:MAG: alpha/beta hydrolase [Cyanobacteria bacterium P01_G01_bin.19]